MSRDIRRLINSVEQPQSFNDGAPASSLQEGGTLVSLDNGRLIVRRKHKGVVFKSTMSRDGNEIIDKKLTTNELEYKRKFIDYRVFNHSFTDDLPATKVYLPWSGPSENTTMLDPRNGFLTPFKMICQKLIFRFDDIDTGGTDIVFSINRIDETDDTIDVVCTFDYTSIMSRDTVYTINVSDWSASPIVEANRIAGIGVQADDTNITTSERHIFVTSVWKTFIEV